MNEARVCNECIYFFNFKNLFGERGTFFGTCSKKNSDHFKHILAHAHPKCIEFYLKPERKLTIYDYDRECLK